MADVTVPNVHDEHRTTTGIPNTKLGMWLFLSSECLLFGALITTYVLYRNSSIKGPYPDQVFSIAYTSVSSFVLLASSLSMVLALAAAQRRDRSRMRLWLLTTALLGMAFVGGQVYEFTVFYTRDGLSLSTNLFGSTFYVLTGFHGVHVTVGILMLLGLLGMSLTDRLPDDPAFPIEMVGLYWHFVDIVWIVIFMVVYLIPTGPGPGK